MKVPQPVALPLKLTAPLVAPVSTSASLPMSMPVSTSQALLIPSAQAIDADPRRSKQTCELSSDDKGPFSSHPSDSDADLPQQPGATELPVGEMVESDTGNPHVSCPSEDFSSYSQMLSRLAKTLKLRVD